MIDHPDMRLDFVIADPQTGPMRDSVASVLSWTLFVLCLAACLHPWVSAGMALSAGLVLGLSLGTPFRSQMRRWTSRMLAISIIGLGADMNLGQVIRSGVRGAGFAFMSISLVLVLGWVLIRLLRIDRRTGLLVSVGTAICGGSAIAAAAPVLEAEDGEISLALATVFLLNAAALLVFPPLGRLAGMDGPAFGLWAALGIQDTSSVVGAALAFGHGALGPATTTKLARALWIVPLTFGLALGRPLAGKAKRPWFILGFVLAAALVTALPVLQPVGHIVATGARRLLVVTLFLIGAGLDRATLSRVGFRPFLLGILLWAALGSVSFWAIHHGWAHL